MPSGSHRDELDEELARASHPTGEVTGASHVPRVNPGMVIRGAVVSRPFESPSARLLAFFRHDHLPPHLAEVSRPLSYVARAMNTRLPDGPEKTAGLRKLLEAKDCFVRAALEDEETRS